MALFFIIIFGCYAVLVMLLLFGWARAMEMESKPAAEEKKISVIIPFRNEEANLPALISSLQSQVYPTEKFEVVLVNDHSTDESFVLAKKLTESLAHVSILDLEREEGKKAALSLGIQKASGDIVVTTDADCRAPDNWLTEINKAFSDAHVKMAVGAVRLKGSGGFGRMQEIEMASLVGVTGGTLGWGVPSMCNGANLAFLRAPFFEVGGYLGNEKISSGDDEFLMRKFASRWKGSVRFLPESRAVVTTSAEKDLRAFVNQRLRWAGKWRKNNHLPTKVMAVTVLFFHISFISAVIFSTVGLLPITTLLLMWASRLFVESLLLITVTRFLSIRWSWLVFLFLQFLYSFYVVSIGLASQVVAPVWKGRTVVSGV